MVEVEQRSLVLLNPVNEVLNNSVLRTVYYIDPDGLGISRYCDMTLDDGGWACIHQRCRW